jgi:hypothetical protein
MFNETMKKYRKMLGNFFYSFIFLIFLILGYSILDYGTSTNFGFWFDFEPKFWPKPKDAMIPKPKPKCIPKPKFRPKPKPKPKFSDH